MTIIINYVIYTLQTTTKTRRSRGGCAIVLLAQTKKVETFAISRIFSAIRKSLIPAKLYFLT